MLSAKACIEIEGSVFLQFLFNRLQATRNSLYDVSLLQKKNINAVMQEQLRTIRQLFMESDKNGELRKILMESLNYSFNDIHEMTPLDVDTIMSFIPEASFKMISIGTPCIGKDGKTVCSLGVMKQGDASSNA